MKLPKSYRIALLFNANKNFDRDVIAGVAAYMSSRRVSWDLFLEEDFRTRLAGMSHWRGDGMIANFDDPAVAGALADCRVPVVAAGSSYQNAAAYPAGVPYVASDSFKLVKLAYEHLIDVGLRNFAMYSLPVAEDNGWAREREHAFCTLLQRDQIEVDIFRGQSTSAPAWAESVEQQVNWLRSLPKPVGIVAVSDARARHLLQACQIAGISVPEEVALIGIDNDPLASMLARIPLSSVTQGAHEIGRTAAHLLHQMLGGVPLDPRNSRILVPPAGIAVRASSGHAPTDDPRIMRARHFIRQYGCRNIKSFQVADFVGISRTSLEALFRREFDCSVHDEILRFRLEAATGMLALGKHSIADVALRCGFTTSQYMHAVFKREFGCTPKAYQERLRAGCREEDGEAALAQA